MKSLTAYLPFAATLVTAAFAVEIDSSATGATCDCKDHYDDLQVTIALLEEQLKAF